MIIYAKPGRIINLGRCGEKNARTVRFDLSDWVISYGEGSVSLYYEVNGKKTIEAIQTGTIGSGKTDFDWPITETITAEPGIGRCQLVFNSADGKTRNISTWYDTLLATSIYDDIDYSNDAVGWLDQLSTLVANLSNQTSTVETVSDEAQQWARGTKGKDKTPVSEGEIGFEDNSKFYAEKAGESEAAATKAKDYLTGLTIKERIVDSSETAKVDRDTSTGKEIWTFDIPINAPFRVAKWYTTKEKMIEDGTGDVKVGEFASINSTLTDPENGKLYVRTGEGTGENKWKFLCDLSGEQGIQGEQGWTVKTASITDEGKISFILNDPSGTVVNVEGDDFYTWVANMKETIEGFKNAAENAKTGAETAQTLSQKWAVGEQTSEPGEPSDTNNSKFYASASKASAAESKAWATGEGDDTKKENNSKWYSEQSLSYSDTSKLYSQNSAASAAESKAWATGEGDDTKKENNSKYFSDQSSNSASAAATSATNSQGQAEISSQYARGKKLDGAAVAVGEIGYNDNALYWRDQAKVQRLAAEGWATGSQDGTAQTEGTYFQNNAQYFKDKASEFATAASQSATAASGSAASALEYEKEINGILTEAKAVQTEINKTKAAIDTSATAAAASAGEAEGYANKAETSESNASTAKTNAETAQKGAETAKAAAEQAKTDTIAQVDLAKTAQQAAENSASAAAASASDASGSADKSANSAIVSQKWAIGPTETTETPTDTNNAKYWANKAETWYSRMGKVEAKAESTGTQTPTANWNDEGEHPVLTLGIPKGEKGDKGDTGDKGSNGQVFIPAVDAAGNISWTLGDAPSVMPSSQNIKGDKGDKGDTGERGEQGGKGATGETGPQGPTGPSGDVFVPTVDENGNLSWERKTNPTETPTSRNIKGPQGDSGKDGTDGAQGPEGPKGDPGDSNVYVPTVTEAGDLSWELKTNPTETPTGRNIKGPQGDPGKDGTQVTIDVENHTIKFS